jgi:predicted DNA-binding transcriptional regulator YafY
MLETSARLLKALSLLHERRFWTGPELADALGVTERSVRRDVDRLRSLGYPVHATAGVGGGYSLGAGRDLPPLPLDDEEAVAVAIGLRGAATGAVTGIEAAALRALTKLEAVLPQRVRRRVQAMQHVALSLPVRGGRPQVDGATLSAVTAACREEERLLFDYRDRTGAASRRRVEPYRLVHNHVRWYLLAFDEDRDDWRIFRLDRMGTPSGGGRFRPRALPAEDLAEFVARSVQIDAWRYRVRATLHVSAEEALAREPALIGHLTPIDDRSCRLEMAGEDLGWLALFLGYLDLDMDVESPPELRERLLAMGDRVRALAERMG